MAKSVSRLKTELDKAKAALRDAEKREAQRIGNLAAKAGLLELDLSDDEWKTIFKDALARFQKQKTPALPSQPNEKTATAHAP